MTNPDGWTSGSPEKIKYLTDEQVSRFFKAIETNADTLARKRDLALFTLMLSYGLRTAEVPLIRLEHVNLSVRPAQIYITRVKRKASKPRLGRWYGLSEKNEAIVHAWLKARKSDSEYLFPTRQSAQISLPHLTDLVQKYANAAGLGHINPHMFRHTCGIRLARAGRNAFAIQARLGHVSVLSTQVYVQLASPDRHDQDRRDDSAIEGGADD